MPRAIPINTRPLSLPDSSLERLGIGLIVVHGRTVVRCTDTALHLLGLRSNQAIGRDLSLLLNPTQPEAIRRWMSEVYRAPLATAPLEVAANSAPMQRLRFVGGYNEEGSASTRLITVQAGAVSSDAGISDLRRTLRELLDGNPVPTFVLNAEHVVMHWNKACEEILGTRADAVTGTRLQWGPFYKEARPVLADLVLDGTPLQDAAHLYNGSLRRSSIIPDALQAAEFFPHIGESGRWLMSTGAPIRNAEGALIGAIETLVDITELKTAEQALRESHVILEELVQKRTAQLETAKQELEQDIARRERAESELLSRYAELTDLNTQLSDANERFQQAQSQLVQTEKMASIGQLAAGVAHEINNPIGYVFSNFGTLEHYLSDLLNLIEQYQYSEAHITDEALRANLASKRKDLDLEFLREDTMSLMRESREGIERVRKIVQDLKDFSHADADNEWQWADIHRGLESTLNIVNNEIKYRAQVVREFGNLPQVECLPSQLNQVFMNLLVNAAHALDGRPHGTITVRTGVADDDIWVEVSDTGCGISAQTLSKIFDPFFTTKPVGKGTGLGLSLSYGIVQKHRGRIEVESTPQVGTTFRVVLPINQSERSDDKKITEAQA